MLKNQIEAVLFTLGKFVTIEELAKIIGSEQQKIAEALSELKKEYERKNTSIAIQEVEGKFKLNIKKEFAHFASKLLSDREMDSPTTNTLAVIAFKSPVIQSEVIKIRGNKAYEHVRQLLESNLITSEKHGRTRLLKLTPHFYDYFDVAEKEVKLVMEQIKEVHLQKTQDTQPIAPQHEHQENTAKPDETGAHEQAGKTTKKTENTPLTVNPELKKNNA